MLLEEQANILKERNWSIGADSGTWKRGCQYGKDLKYYKTLFLRYWCRETGFTYAIFWTQVQYIKGFKIWYDIGRFCEWKAKIIVSLQISLFPEKLKFLSFSYYSGEDNSANLHQQQLQGGSWGLISIAGLDWCKRQSERSLAWMLTQYL